MAIHNSTPEPRSPKVKFQETRHLKVRSGYYDYQIHRKPSRNMPYRRPVPVPWVQLKGYWLSQAGFPIGTELSVKVARGCITVQPASVSHSG